MDFIIIDSDTPLFSSYNALFTDLMLVLIIITLVGISVRLKRLEQGPHRVRFNDVNTEDMDLKSEEQ